MTLDITFKHENQVLTIYLKGELDHHAVSKIKDTIDLQLVRAPVKKLVLDLGEVSFMDSSGIGLIVGRYNRIRSLGGTMAIKNPGGNLLKILKMSGIDKLMKIS
ncbi:anti-anti-sigma factor SpoIIAA [Thermoclostridium stercorarium subsp. stercorarium DSM 8532]|jgi:stage II sporulation protein AA (anti-sigma F factor antagonist)|uniref:Anti-sigma factor antagonist n=3 Tax=Thermoclostridium stercorarium TaxID=1510 RepID=L7VPM6_THES1|nr:anti-sigma factor antagonist [Thermoclostridium stercorarium]AGC68401.1 anti-anti-sigma factor SpoIIAA [Thermoclostridium stercorarium subsp. stercorarium DSM 8532]AGI39421.1 anti-anti-sigma regulator [Thermoclostridium stercorarium subsp. stercorarium DSM 8532]ANW98761.1 anti-anti-sigma factor [Thermoclostridium stercorarium subsp. thermolacticum DSM 2910]ANX01278.1 anti-anti-sigma factor [Thermoclostridium stercorarium subsp. leptospartum DSM 9219]UZQ86903.1 anti-sigma factor antagonist [